MGSKAGKVILPLVAIGATALITGPAGMGLWGAPVTMGSDAASLAFAEAAANTPAAGGLFSGISGFQQASLALMAGSTLTGIAGSMANAQAQRQALAIQAEQQRVQQMKDRLLITQKEAETQKNLRRALASQTVAFNARGIDPGFGSPLALQERTYGEAEDALDALATQREFVNLGGQLDAAALANRRSTIGTALSQSVFDNLLNFGIKTTNVVRHA